MKKFLNCLPLVVLCLLPIVFLVWAVVVVQKHERQRDEAIKRAVVAERKLAESEERAEPKLAQPRSPKWPALQRKHLKLHPECEACGAKVELNVHHVKPFHLYPWLELDPENLITLCRQHHLTIGHDPDGPWGPAKPDWNAENENVRDHARMWRDEK